MTQISISSLKPADILLSTGSGAVSNVIRKGTGSRFSHAALYIGNGNIIEAIGTGVVNQSLKSAMSDDTLVVVFRHKTISPSQAATAISYARKQVGKKYDASGAASSASGSPVVIAVGFIMGPIGTVLTTGLSAAGAYNAINSEGSFYCSELVAHAFAKANCPIGPSKSSITPKAVSNSSKLTLIGNLK